MAQAQARDVVLVVDNDEDIRATARFVLEDAGYDVLEAANGARALDLLRRCAEPVVVLLDVVMPVRTGVEVLRAAQADARLRRHAYVLWTASRVSVPEELLAALNAPLILKPADIDAILSAVARAAVRLNPEQECAGESEG